MLILSRRIGETIMLDDDISVTLLSITKGQARLGVNAPREVAVHREEIYHRIKKEKTALESHSVNK